MLPERQRAELGAAVTGAGGALAAADRLCRICTVLLNVDGASVSLMHEGSTRGTFGSSGQRSRWLDELQFTFGDGPCFDVVERGQPVLVADLADPAESRWPGFTGAVLAAGIYAVFTFPVTVASCRMGALNLFRVRSGPLTGDALVGALLAAELGALPLLDLMTSQVDWDAAGQGDDGWEQLASLERVEVYQATGMIVAALGVGPVEALVRLRAHAYANGMTASGVAAAVVGRRLSLEAVIDGRS